MVRPRAEDLEEQLKKDELDTDGSEGIGGSASVAGDGSTADTKSMVEEVYGEEPDENDDPQGFVSGEQVNNDEREIQHGEDEEGEEEEELKQNDETLSEAQVPNPYDTFGEDDNTNKTSEE